MFQSFGRSIQRPDASGGPQQAAAHHQRCQTARCHSCMHRTTHVVDERRRIGRAVSGMSQCHRRIQKYDKQNEHCTHESCLSGGPLKRGFSYQSFFDGRFICNRILCHDLGFFRTAMQVLRVIRHIHTAVVPKQTADHLRIQAYP